MELLRDLWAFLKERKRFWLVPIIVVLFLIGVLLIAAGTGAGPFIYSLF